MTSTDGFEATFRLRVERRTAWERLAGGEALDTGAQVWLPGFDSDAVVVEADAPARLRATKAAEPCAGTDIVVTLEDDGTGTRIHVVQSGFGDWFADRRDLMAVGWRFIVADLQTSLATGAHAGRHLRRWGDLGASTVALDGGIRVTQVRSGGLAARLGLADGDLLVVLAGAPVASLDDLVTVLRVLPAEPVAVTAEWVRDGQLLHTM